MNRMKKIEVSLLAGLLIAMLSGAVAAFAQDCGALRDSVLRLHILANSDAADDQALKLEVRDRILAECGQELSAFEGKAAAEEQARRLLPRIEEIASGVVRENGRDYPVRAEIVRMYFDMRTYADLTMPAGVYDAVRVTLGKAEGYNWWCVLYPPVCVSAAADVSALREDTVAGESPELEPRFKIVEWIEALKQRIEEE